MTRFLLLLAFVASSLCGYGWFDTGHMVVAQIAASRLEPEAQAQIDSAIAAIGGFSPKSATFVEASCWADDLAVGKARFFATWHHCEVPYSPGAFFQAPEKALSAPQRLIWALEQCMATLRDSASGSWERAFALRFLIHLVGDVHQPLHVCALFDERYPGGDRGGNLFEIRGLPVKNLHLYWDSACGLFYRRLARPLDPAALEDIRQMAVRLTDAYPEEAGDDAIDDARAWARQTYALAPIVYDGILPGGEPGELYQERGRMVCERQLARAGYRLAHLLNKLFAPATHSGGGFSVAS